MATQTETSPPQHPKTLYPVDAEHGQLRLAVAGVFILIAVMSFFILVAVIPANMFNLLAVLGSLIISAALTSGIERQLKARWPSGREVGLSDEAIYLSRQGHVRQAIALNGEAQLLRWCFEINKRARVPRGWWMVAVAVRNMATEETIAVYALVSPEDYSKLNETKRFVPLKKLADSEGGGIRVAGQQKRLHTAEQVRWNDGAEMKPEDFRALVDRLEAHFDA
jgi:hypothetical protein